MSQNIAILLAGGKWTRLAPLTDTIPKPLLPLDGEESILERHMRFLSPFIDRFVLITHYLEEQIHERIGENFCDTPVIYAHQDNPKWGTGDAFRAGILAADISPGDRILTTYTDDLWTQALYQRIGENIDHDFAIGYYMEDRERLKQFGIILHEEGKYVRIVEKPEDFVSNFVNIGAYCVSGRILDFVPPDKPKFLWEDQEEYIFVSIDEYARNYPMEILETPEWVTMTYIKHLEEARKILVENPEY